MRDTAISRPMFESDEERIARLIAADKMKTARAKETEEQAAIRRIQEAQRMARHRAKKKRCLDENLAREISKIAELSKMPDASNIPEMAEMNMNKISAELKQMMERGKVPEHIVQMAQLAEFSKMSELNKLSQDMAKRYEMEKMAEYAKNTEYMKMVQMSELAKMNEMMKMSEMAKYQDIAKINEMMKMSQMAKINEVQRMNELAKINEMMKMSEMAKYSNDIAQINEMTKEIAKLNEKSKMNEMIKMAGMQSDVTKMAEMAKLTELAKLNEITITKLNDPSPSSDRAQKSDRISEPVINVPNPRNIQSVQPSVQITASNAASSINFPSVPGQGKYAQLLVIIEELGRDIRLSYAGSRSAAERLKMSIQHARLLVRECLLETEHNARQ